MDIVTQNQQRVECELLTDSGQNIKDRSGHSDEKPIDGPV